MGRKKLECGREIKSIRIEFNINDYKDGIIYHYLRRYSENRSATTFIKRLIFEEMLRYSDVD